MHGQLSLKIYLSIYSLHRKKQHAFQHVDADTLTICPYSILFILIYKASIAHDYKANTTWIQTTVLLQICYFACT